MISTSQILICRNSSLRRVALLLCAFGLAFCSPKSEQVQDADGGNPFDNNIDPFGNTDLQPGTGETPEQISQECGVAGKDISDPNAIMLQKTMKGWPRLEQGTKFIISYKVVVIPVVNISATASQTTTTTSFNITAESLFESLAIKQAEKRVEPFRGTDTSYGVDTGERISLGGKYPEWQGIYCTISPDKKLESNKGGNSISIEFEPPLPSSVSPLAMATRYQKEIGAGKTFTNITARVLSSSDPNLATGTTAVGTVRITPVQPTVQIESLSRGVISLAADSAYRIESDFGGPEQTRRMGIDTVRTIYLDHANRDIKYIASEGSEGVTILMSESEFSQHVPGY